MTTHPKCGKSWGGKRAEHCPACHETFSGTSSGDKHRVGEHGADRRCVDPATVGLVQDERGIWRWPPSETPHWRARGLESDGLKPPEASRIPGSDIQGLSEAERGGE